MCLYTNVPIDNRSVDAQRLASLVLEWQQRKVVFLPGLPIVEGLSIGRGETHFFFFFECGSVVLTRYMYLAIIILFKIKSSYY